MRYILSPPHINRIQYKPIYNQVIDFQIVAYLRTRGRTWFQTYKSRALTARSRCATHLLHKGPCAGPCGLFYMRAAQ